MPSAEISEPGTGLCDACGGPLGQVHLAAEMMFGTREAFRYGECTACGSLQLLDPPGDLSAYYPPDYYSLADDREGLVVRAARRVRAETAVRGMPRTSRLLGAGRRPPQWPAWLEIAGIDRSARILDIGSGSGATLLALRSEGFTDLTGTDAFIEAPITRSGITIHRATPQELSGVYDMVMLNHSFEHMPDPLGTLQAIRRLVRRGGTVMLRIPVAGAFAWRHYGVDWVALDPPRHLYLLTPDGVGALAERAHMEVVGTVFDSTAFQFWGSEQYRMGIPLVAPTSHHVDPSASPFSRRQIAAWERRADDLNAAQDGDEAAFFLRAAVDPRDALDPS